jgi:GT2 family glycosyltransferase
VYVVLVNFNSSGDTVECLESLLRSDYAALHVIVVDNGSTDASMQQLVEWADGTSAPRQPRSAALRHLAWPPVSKPVTYLTAGADASPQSFCTSGFADVTFISSPRNLGFAGGNNIALRLLLDVGAVGYACLINNDMVVAPDAVTALITALEADPTAGVVGGVILDYDEPEIAQSVGGGHMSRLTGMSTLQDAGLRRDELRAPGQLGYVSGGLLAARLETIRAVGTMDEAYFLYAEDADWGERMRQHGCRLGCAMNAFVWHKGSQATGAGSPFHDYYVVRSSLMFVRKHAAQYSGLAFAHALGRFLIPKILRGQWERARSVVRALGDVARQ